MKSKALLGNVLCILTLCVLFCGLSVPTNANNIRILGRPKLEQDTLKHHATIRFDIAWDNSWKTTKPENHDAAWIFVKCWDGESWNHAYLKDTAANTPGSTDAKKAACFGDERNYREYRVTSRDGKQTKMKMVLEPGYSMAYPKWHLDPTETSEKCVVGFFLRRQDYGSGHVYVPGVSLVWNYARQGFVDEDDLVVKVFAVEMVYVPDGAYYLGGRGETANERNWGSFTTNGNTLGSPMVITSENAITVANSTDANTLWACNNLIKAGTIPAAFPKGYKAFYIMKYEMTQGAYCDYLNTLSQGQQDGHFYSTLSTAGRNAWFTCHFDGSGYSLYRNCIKIKQPAPQVIFGCDGNNNNVFDEVDSLNYDYRSLLTGKKMARNKDGQDLAMNFVSMRDLLAYAEFSGLRSEERV